MRKILSIIAAVAASGLSAPALASDILWLDSDHTAYNGYYANGARLKFSGGGVDVWASAWSIHDDKIYTAQLGVWSEGLGVKNGSGDNSHTVDNSGYLDFILFQFDRAVELDMARFTTGWHDMNDTDATIGYDITNLPYGSLPAWHGGSQSQLSALDFYGSNASNGNSYRDINPNNNIGNLWLIGASFNNPDGSKKLDGFKLEKLTFNVPTPTPHTAVPEPTTWAMMLVGFFGLGGAMRSSRRRPHERSAGSAGEFSAA